MGSVTSIEARERGAGGYPVGGMAWLGDSLADELVEHPCQFCGGSRCDCGNDVGVLLQR